MQEIKLPQLGQTVEEAAIVQWYKREGERIEEGQPLFSVQTDKAEIECESSAAGVLRKILVEPDVTVPVLTVIALVGDPDEPLPDLSRYKVPSVQERLPEEPSEKESAAPKRAEPIAVSRPKSSRPAPCASPRATKLARSLHIDVSAIEGTGVDGRVMEEDVLRYAERSVPGRVGPAARRLAVKRDVDVLSVRGTGPGGTITKTDVTRAVRRIPLTPARRIIAERMCESFQGAPHYYIAVEVDMGETKRFRQGMKGFKPSYNDLVMYAVAQTLRQFPKINARWVGDAIEEVVDINLGFAVAAPLGLVVPVVRQAQDKTLEAIHRECRLLIKKALAGKLTPDDYGGNTFTVSNLGSFGVHQFMAIINPPDSAILALGQIKDRPVVIEGVIQIRPVMNMTLSCDHRTIDGALAAEFMARLKEFLESGDFSE